MIRDKEIQASVMCVDLWEWAKNVLVFVSHNAHQRPSTKEETFNNQADRLTHPVDVSQPLSLATPRMTRWSLKKRDNDGRSKC